MIEPKRAKEITNEVINSFINGTDPMERIVNLEYKYDSDKIKVYYRNENDVRCYKMENFYPFVWATRHACEKLCDGDRSAVSSLMRKYGIGIRSLDTKNNKGEVVESIATTGYIFMFYAKRPMSYQKFLKFFKEANNPIYSKSKDGDDDDEMSTKEDSRQYLIVTPQEQFMISTGKRFFKGYDDYDDIIRMIFDLETEGLDPRYCRINQFGIRFNRPVMYKGNKVNFERILTVTGDTKEEKDASELHNIKVFLSMIQYFKPDVITAHNGENFDWNFIIERCKMLGTSIEDICIKENMFEGEVIRKNTKESVLKLGGEVESFYQTIVPSIVITDSLHAVRRAQAIDSNMLRADLKYVTKYSKMEKSNRVYVPGDKISDTWGDLEEHYAFNENDGDWYIYNPNFIEVKNKEKEPEYDLEYFIQKSKTQIRVPTHDEWCEINAEGISVTWDEYVADIENENEALPSAEELYADYIKSFNEEQEASSKFIKGMGSKGFTIYTRNYIVDGYKLVTGKYIVERYLLDDLWECDKVEHRYNTSNFMICKMLPVPYQKCCTMGTAGQWKALLMAWSYENGLAIPQFGEGGTFTGGLSRLLKVGFVDNVAKFDYNSLYPSIILTWDISDEKDIMESTLKFLEYVLTEREKYKGLTKKAGKEKERILERLQNRDYKDKEEGKKLNEELKFWESEESKNDKKQLPLKIFGNSFFGSYGAENLFPWGSKICAERITCTGRMSLRLMIYHFNSLGYQPIVGDTDGFNFKLPSEYRYNESNPYIGKGLNRNVVEGKAYTGFAADVAEFNDLYMRRKMGLGIDEIVASTINFSRKNYADHFPENAYPKDVKLVGNTIKSKKMPEYISKFLSKGVRLLLQNNGKGFLDEYYSYVEKIYNYQIPLKDIASKGKVKKSLKEYVKDCSTLTKAGRPKSRQAWMELALKSGVDVKQGETLYYINTGKSKSQADVKKITKYVITENDIFGEKEVDITAKVEKEYKACKKNNEISGECTLEQYVKSTYPTANKVEEIVLNAILLSNDIIDSETEVFCKEGEEYYSAKYIDQFNKRITPLLVCFSKDIRDKILITKPEDRQYFTEDESKLTSGQPNKETDQDTYEALMTMEDKEIKFWAAHPEFEIPFLAECNMNWDEILADYLRRKKEEEEMGINEFRAQIDVVIRGLEAAERNKIVTEGKLPKKIVEFAVVDPKTGNINSKKYPEYVLISLPELIELVSSDEDDEE